MKRLICLLMTVCLYLSGCAMFGERIKEPVIFYYVREDYQRNMGQVVDSEYREASGHQGDLAYLFALYMMGPSSEGLVLPLPKGTTIIPIEHTDNEIVLSLSEQVQSMTDAEFSLAGACLGLTCMELSDVSRITIVAEDRSMSFTADNLIMLREMQ